MRPTPAELISGVRRILREVIEPDLGSEYARARLAEIRAVLAQVDWDDAGIELVRRTGALRELLRDCLEWMDAEPERAVWFERQRGPLGEALHAETPHGETLDGEDAGGGFAAHAERMRRYEAVIVLLIDPIEDWVLANPGDTGAASIRAGLIAHCAGTSG